MCTVENNVEKGKSRKIVHSGNYIGLHFSHPFYHHPCSALEEKILYSESRIAAEKFAVCWTLLID